MRRFLALASVPWLAGCATTGDKYPSLAIRDVERAQGRFEAAPAALLDVPEIPAASGPLAERLAALGAAAASSHQAFLASAPRAARLASAAAGSAIGSDAWAAAQVALADLDSARSATAVALGDLDALMVGAAIQARDVSAIEMVRQQVIAQVGDEDETLARLRAQVR
ncbi:MAG: hypothetical protein K2Y17_03695 [Qipengyuania sp.]|nr:hypothetical protein [Qipengyuania sp.]